jgi:hypothetical protein
MWFVATLLGAVGALTIVSPAHAAAACSLTFRANAWPTIDGRARWDVEATIANTGTSPSTNWTAFISFPYSSGAVVPQYWNVSPLFAGYIWNAAAWNRVISPGQTVNFGFEVDVPNWDISPLPASSECGIG